MGGVGIDWPSTLIFLGAYLFAQIRAVPAQLRYFVLAGACGVIAVMRLRGGAQGINLLFVALAAGLCVYYVVKAFRFSRRPQD